MGRRWRPDLMEFSCQWVFFDASLQGQPATLIFFRVVVMHSANHIVAAVLFGIGGTPLILSRIQISTFSRWFRRS